MEPTLQRLRLSALCLLPLMALALELSYTTGQEFTKCPEIAGLLGASVLLPLSPEAGYIIRNSNVRVQLSFANSLANSEFKKLVSKSLHMIGSTGHLETRYQLQLGPPSLEILRSQRQDEGWYNVNLEGNITVQNFCWRLRLYEQISALEVRVLNHTYDSSGMCNVTLACLAMQGDHVVYSWSQGARSLPPDTANGSQELQLVLGPQDTDQTYICTASNPVSNSSQTFQPAALCQKPGPSLWGSYQVPILATSLVLVLILLCVLVLVLRKGKAKKDQPAEKAQVVTIYSQVQKAGSLHRTASALNSQDDPCMTIYAAASAPVLESAHSKLNPLPCSPEARLITVHVNKALPES